MLPASSTSQRQQQQQQHLPITTTTATENASGHATPTIVLPIDFDTQSQISGSESQILQVQLRPHQILHAESGAMLYMTRGIHMETSMGTAPASSSAFATGLTRVVTGQNWMISEFRYHLPSTIDHHHRPLMEEEEEEDHRENNNERRENGRDYGTVGLGTDFPAKILKFELSSNNNNDALICQKGAYLAGSHDVTMDMAYVKSFAGGFFGGEGFILQRLRAGKLAFSPPTTTTTPPPSHHSITNHRDETTAAAAGAASVAVVEEEEKINNHGRSSTVFLKAYGTVVKRDLQPGEKLRVSSGCLVCMTSTIDFDVTMMTGFANVVFGGQGLFVTTLTGPGTVWLQSMPMDKMVSEIARRVPSGGGIGLGIPIMGGGGGADNAGVDGTASVGSAGEDGAGGDSGASAVTTDAAALEADRNATVASSAEVPPSSSPSDPESPESLFGDAAFGGGSRTASAPLGVESSSSSDFDASSPQSIEATTNDVPDFDESTTSSEDDLFEDDGTTFSTYDGAGDDATEMPPSSDGGEASSSILGQLWNLFRDLTDRD